MSLADLRDDAAVIPGPWEQQARTLLADARKARARDLRDMADELASEAVRLRAKADQYDPPPPCDVPFDEVNPGDTVLIEQEWWVVVTTDKKKTPEGLSQYLYARPLEGPGQSVAHPFEIPEGQRVTVGSF